MTTLIEKASEKVLSIQDAEQRRRCARILRESVYWEGFEVDELPISASEIMTMNMISEPDVLSDNLIFIGKTEIITYAKELGFVLREKGFRKRINRKACAKAFDDGREAVMAGRKLLFTYAEARFLLKLPSRGQVPEEIIGLINGNG